VRATRTDTRVIPLAPEPAALPAPKADGQSPANAWLLENALFQSINGTIWASMLAAWMLIGTSLAASTAAALVGCIAVPILGWFIGLPIVLMFAMVAAMCWFMGVMAILGAWACVAFTVAAVTFARRLLDSRR
jgi:hypothetical protein